MLLSIQNISKYYGEKLVLRDISADLEENDRVGLIGLNGAGKSTLIRLICQIEEAEEGFIARKQGLSLGYLEQNAGLSSARTIWEEMMSVFDRIWEMEHTLRQMEQRIGEEQPGSESYRVLAEEYARMQQHFENIGGYLTEVKVRTVLAGMGFSDKSVHTVIDTLSGGEKTRLALAKLLLEEPDVLILDEPTNHLDFQTLQWLEEFLLSYKGAVLIVSHDRYFLDRVVGKIWEIEEHELCAYPGNYTKYAALKEDKLIRQQKEYEMQMKKAAELRDYVDRNLERASTSNMAKSRRKQLEKLEIPDKPVFQHKRVKFRFPFEQQTVNDVLSVQDMSLAVGEGAEKKELFTHFSLEVKRQQRVAIIGANGMGKSSFLKAVLGRIPYQEGYVAWGKHVKIAYYDQENADVNPDNTLLEELWSRHKTQNEQAIRTMLGQVLLTGDNVYKQVGVVSGGERAKLAFAVMMMEKGNVLVLDEPTNHLDLDTKETLEKGLLEFEGTILFVSHDRYFLNRVATRIVDLQPEGIDIYEGNFDYYQEKRALKDQAAAAAATEKREQKAKTAGYRTKRQRSDEVKRKKRIEELEAQVEALEQEVRQLEELLGQKEIAADYEKVQEIYHDMEEKRALSASLGEEWLALSEGE